MRIVSLSVLLLSLSLLAPAAAFAEDEPAPPPAEESADETSDRDEAGDIEVVVTASRRESPKRDAPAMVTIVHEEELQRAAGGSIDDALRFLPSLAYSRTREAECGPGRDITMRGIPEQKRSLVLVDGLPLNDGVNGSVNWSFIPRSAVDRIEIVRGPMSALYGSGAMGGVINILTKTPERPNETFLEGGYGSLNTYTASIVQGGMFDKVGYQFSGNLYHSDGYVQAVDPQSYHTKHWRTDVSALGKVFLRIDEDQKLTLSVNHVSEAFSRGRRTDKQAVGITGFSLAYDGEPSEGLQIDAAAYVQFMDREVDLGTPDRTDPSNSYTALEHTEFDDSLKFGQIFQASMEVGGFSTFTVGLDTSYVTLDRHNEYYFDTVDREAEAEGNQLQASLFAQDELRFETGAHRFLLTPGVRVDFVRSADGHSLDTAPGALDPVDEDYNDQSWSSVNPKLALVYQYGRGTTVRASVGRSFSAPKLFELYTVFTRGPMLLYGNPDLDPETAWSAELGIDQLIGKRLLARATGYYTRGLDFVGYRSISDWESRVDNITDVQIAGVDFELRYDIHRMVSVYGGYTFNWSEIVKDSDTTLEGNELPFQPYHRARLGVVFKYNRWITIDLSGVYEGERYADIENTDDKKLDGHFLLAASLSGDVPGGLHWSLLFENLLDDAYEVYSIPNERSVAPGLRIDGRLAYSF